ncbi:MAG: ParB N-terminal domain-containing protein [Acidobacteriota bacterium]
MPRRKRAADPSSRGLQPSETLSAARPVEIAALEEAVARDGGSVIGAFREPLGGRWQILAALPIERVAPTPFQRDLSEAHVTRLARVIDSLDRFLDPIIAVRDAEGAYWTPNGNHRLSALRRLGARTVIALILPDPRVAYKILALNTEKAHNLREKSLEVIRMARDLAARESRSEADFALEFEEPAFLTLGAAYERNGRFAGGAYHPLLKRLDAFSAEPLAAALAERERRAGRLLEIDEAVAAAMAALSEKGFQSPYLRPFVIARVNPVRFLKGPPPEFDAALDRMLASARKFRPDSVKPEQIARAAGPPPAEE